MSVRSGVPVTRGNQLNVAVVGAGYVGLVTSACLAELGHRVICLEIDRDRLNELQSGRLPIYEPSLEDLVLGNVESGRLSFAGDYAEALAHAAFAFICVPTPPLDNGHADTRHVITAARGAVEHGAIGLTVVIKSTVPVGTGDHIAHLAVYRARADVCVVSNPEFLRQGTAVRDFFQPDRIVIGTKDHEAGRGVAELYSGVSAPVVETSRRSAEMAKYASNALLATRISFMNEIAALCDATGANVDEVARIVGMDERIGPHFLRAGLGWGGSCFPKDVLALASMAALHGRRAPILDAVMATNDGQREVALQRILDAVAGIDDPRVTLLGLAFKPDTDDLRGSPAIDIIGRLSTHGIDVRAHDPVTIPNAARLLPGIGYRTDAYEAVEGADVVLLATEWDEYLHLDWRRIRAAMRGDTVIDGRNVLNEAHLRRLGFRYVAFGRGGQDWHELVEMDEHRTTSQRGRRPGRNAANRVPVADSAA